MQDRPPFARQYKTHWIVKIENLFEIRRDSRYALTWAWANTIKQAKTFIDEREQEKLCAAK